MSRAIKKAHHTKHFFFIPFAPIATFLPIAHRQTYVKPAQLIFITTTFINKKSNRVKYNAVIID